jgi:hypothetical protein
MWPPALLIAVIAPRWTEALRTNHPILTPTTNMRTSSPRTLNRKEFHRQRDSGLSGRAAILGSISGTEISFGHPLHGHRIGRL